ncbi:hypothetical protein [Carboxylicivirga marina]|uniref:Uncharacterized protein n=1 Tax=Carboxylicivirga marina TaxID=2800988 RepID=A0ABS1HGE2_9BACT|nr:hypothetical protein [Carboxylicivirga marina]MBK3516745.1 hypothetical protein [Carboxylicivirga marina]
MKNSDNWFKGFLIYNAVVIIILLLSSCQENTIYPENGIYPEEPDGEIREFKLSFSNDIQANTEGLGTFSLEDWLEQEYDPAKLEHNYVTTGYTVKIDRAWIIDENRPAGGYYDDLEFEDVDLNDQEIIFQSAGFFSIEVEHPNYRRNNASYEAYYGFEKTRYNDVPANSDIIVNMELLQHAVFLVFRTLDIHYTIEEMKIDDLIVEEYQPVYLSDRRRFSMEIKHDGYIRRIDRDRSGDSGAATYFWVESILFE